MRNIYCNGWPPSLETKCRAVFDSARMTLGVSGKYTEKCHPPVSSPHEGVTNVPLAKPCHPNIVPTKTVDRVETLGWSPNIPAVLVTCTSFDSP